MLHTREPRTRVRARPRASTPLGLGRLEEHRSRPDPGVLIRHPQCHLAHQRHPRLQLTPTLHRMVRLPGRLLALVRWIEKSLEREEAMTLPGRAAAAQMASVVRDAVAH